MAFKDPVKIPQVTTTSDFINKANPTDLSGLSLNELADRYEQIERQGQLLQGIILLEVRNRFKSDNDFGDWVKMNDGLTLCSTTPQHRSRLMNLARFFKDRDMKGISITAAYEISAPTNADIAEDIYSTALFKNLPVAEIKRQIALKKGIDNPLISVKSSQTTTKTGKLISSKNAEKLTHEIILDEVLYDFIDEEKLKILQKCIEIINSKNSKPQFD